MNEEQARNGERQRETKSQQQWLELNNCCSVYAGLDALVFARAYITGAVYKPFQIHSFDEQKYSNNLVHIVPCRLCSLSLALSLDSAHTHTYAACSTVHNIQWIR